MVKQNVIKGWITTIIGTATMVLTLILIFTQVIDFVWEGIGGLVVGSILLMAPQTIEKKVTLGLKMWGLRSGGVAEQPQDPVPPADKQD